MFTRSISHFGNSVFSMLFLLYITCSFYSILHVLSALFSMLFLLMRSELVLPHSRDTILKACLESVKHLNTDFRLCKLALSVQQAVIRTE